MMDDEEMEPESLRKKWEAEEFDEQLKGKQMIDCRHCGKPIDQKSFSCLYCGERIITDSGPLGRFAHWIKEGQGIFILILVLAGFLLLLLQYLISSLVRHYLQSVMHMLHQLDFV